MNPISPAFFAAALFLAPLLSAAQTAPQPNEPASNQAQAKAPPVPVPEQRAPSADDPRVCLEFATNMEVHVCAEKYRPRRRAH